VTPRVYLDTICKPTVAEFGQEPTSILRAWCASIALFHFEDYLAGARGISEQRDRRALRAEMESEFPGFRMLADIANANKHFELTREGPRSGLTSRHFQVGRGAAFSDGSYYSDGSTHADTPDVIRVEFGGERIDLFNLCRRCLTYLETKS
jgi:hypothetical protein